MMPGQGPVYESVEKMMHVLKMYSLYQIENYTNLIC